MRKRLILTIFALNMIYLWGVRCVADVSSPHAILISPFKIVSSGQSSVLQQGIDAFLGSRLSDRASIVTVLDAAQNPITDANEAKTATESLHGDFLIYGTVVKFGETITLDVFLYDGAKKEVCLHFHDMGEGDASILKILSAFADKSSAYIFGTGTPLESMASTHPANPALKRGGFFSGSLWASPTISDDIVGIASGDIDGDQSPDLVVAQPHSLSIQAFEKDTLVSKTKFEIDSHLLIIGVDCADLNHNGRSEIFVSMVRDDHNTLNAMILEWDGATMNTLASDMNCVFRSQYGLNGRDTIILTQKNKSLNTMLQGSIQHLNFTDKGYVPSNTLTVPPGTDSVYSLGLSEDTQGAFYALYADNRLRIFDKNMDIAWESDSRFGGGVGYLSMNDPNDRDLTNRLYLEPRLVFMDLDRDGINELITVQNDELSNHLFSKFKYFKKGRIVFLKNGGLAWHPVFETENITGYISDFCIADTDNDGQPELIFAVVKKGKRLFSENKGYIAVQKWSVP